MRIRTLKTLAVALAVVLGTAVSAQALTITPNLAIDSGDQTGQAAINAYLLATYGISNPSYTDNVGGAEEGTFAPNYKTEYFATPTDPSEADITHTGGAFITGNPIYLLVKDGNASPAWYLFNLTTILGGPWNGTETLELRNFWPEGGAISHVSIYGGGASVPDGGSVALLLGMALMGLAGFRRMMN